MVASIGTTPLYTPLPPPFPPYPFPPPLPTGPPSLQGAPIARFGRMLRVIHRALRRRNNLPIVIVIIINNNNDECAWVVRCTGAE